MRDQTEYSQAITKTHITCFSGFLVLTILQVLFIPAPWHLVTTVITVIATITVLTPCVWAASRDLSRKKERGAGRCA